MVAFWTAESGDLVSGLRSSALRRAVELMVRRKGVVGVPEARIGDTLDIHLRDEDAIGALHAMQPTLDWTARENDIVAGVSRCRMRPSASRGWSLSTFGRENETPRLRLSARADKPVDKHAGIFGGAAISKQREADLPQAQRPAGLIDHKTFEHTKHTQ